MKIEVLKDIKNAEEDYKKMISQAQERRKSLIASAELEADNLIHKAQEDAEEFKKQQIADARKEAEMRHARIISDGKAEAVALESRGRQNLAKAVDLLVTRFKEQLNVSA
ncbi:MULTISPECIES: ATP synthase archaeal subunit H [Methanospirillum]|uniref:ATP synthase archaeal subunit H n=1 Tax=Methanospirillum lacunae TaxID=668570 RepID=A0A2V2MYJ9_9EURY|nr:MULTISPECIES: ATP synthase archaeal subunit H [Methanospirillum]PWR73204.1 ATP synthase archaeal subunit H [Methanospirillum lacunae]HWQ64497.1 ATP synthase archaeal subunit H [Methanospirillum sp.]